MSHLEDTFEQHWRILRPDESWPMPERQFAFHPARRWRFDFAWPSVKVAVEIQGGTFSRGGHSRGAGQSKDFEKLNEAQRLGWRVVQLDTKALAKKRIAETIDYVIGFLSEVGAA